MDDPASTTSAGATGSETPNQLKARLRREKMHKKLAESGEDRLNRIKALNGGVAPPEEVLGGPAVPTTQAATGSKQATVDDPDEVDIDTISGTGTPSRPLPSNTQNDPFAAAMSQMQQRQGAGGAGEEDPMMKMMQQLSGMMGGGGQGPGDPSAQMPAMLQSLLSGGGGSAQAQPAPATGSAYIWRITHAIFAFTLAIYIALTSTFNGSKLARSEAVYTATGGYGLGPKLFYIFATAELLLQSTRYFMEKGQLQGTGIFAKVANSGFVPEPYAGNIRILGRYVGILQTIMADATVIVFVFGAVAWWQGLVEI